MTRNSTILSRALENPVKKTFWLPIFFHGNLQSKNYFLIDGSFSRAEGKERKWFKKEQHKRGDQD